MSLSYNTGGSKVADMASWVGLGFSLNAGGCISRTVYGLPDENRRTNPAYSLPQSLTAGQAKEELMAADVDYQPDVFYFNFNGKSGKFVLSNSSTISISPHQNLKIQAYDINGNPLDPPFYGMPTLMFKITDENGIVYEFKDYETNRTVSFDPDQTQSPNVKGPGVPLASTTAWYLTDMYSPTGDTIKFAYGTYELMYDLPSSEQQFVFLSGQTIGANAPPTQNRLVKNAVRSDNINKRLQQILFSNGSVRFNTRQPREDLIGDSVLNQIMVYRKNGTLLKGFSLNYKYSVGSVLGGLQADTASPSSTTDNFYASWINGISSSSNYRLMLTGISELDNASIPDGRNYSFDYDVSLGGLPSRFSKQRDYWGYYNGNTDNETSFLNYQLVGDQNNPSSYVFTGKEPDSNACRQNMLIKITYPTGGYTQFNYEMHNAYVGRGVLPPDVVSQTCSMPIDFPSYNTPGVGFVDTTINGIACYYKTFTFNTVGAGGYANINIAHMLYQGGTKPVMKFDIYDSNNQPYLLMYDLENNSLTQTTYVQVNSTTRVYTYNLSNYYFPNGTYKVIFTPITSFIGNSTYLNTYLSQPACIINGWSNIVVHTDTVDISRNIGGVRIRSTVDYDPVTNKYLQKNYNYNLINSSLSSGELVAGLSFIYPLTEFVVAPSDSINQAAYYSYIVLNGESNYALSTTQGSNVGYSTVTVTETDAMSGTPNGKSEYHYSSPKIFPDYYGSSPGPTDNFPYPPADSRDWERGLQLQRIDYKYVGGQYVPLRTENDSYGSPVFVDTEGGFVARYLVEVFPGIADTSAVFSGPAGAFANPETFNVAHYQLASGYVSLLTKSVTQVENGDSITETTNYAYGDAPSNMLPTSIASIDSKGNTVTTHLTYPFDYPVTNPITSQGRGVLNLQQHHILSPVVEKYVQKSAGTGTAIGVISGVYTSFKPSQTLLDTIFRLETPGPIQNYSPVGVSDAGTSLNSLYTPYISFGAYDNFGNLLQQSKIGDISQVYVWDYNAKYPIAAIKNAQSGDVAYTSFEADGAGNWTIGSGSVNTTTAITGHASYNLMGTISRSGLNSGATYIVSYWTTGNSLSISGTMAGFPTKGKTIFINNANWTLYVHKVSGQSTITVSGSGIIDELRLYPSTAQMTTYTYDPLIGMTSQTDAGNRVTYYEYDGLARLKRVRDQDYNIVKTLDYQYQALAGCGNGCYFVPLQTFAGTATLGYPVGVFNVNGKLLGNAANPQNFANVWNSDTADARIGTLAPGGDSLHFNMTLNTGQVLPASVTGCRYYQVDLAYNQLDAVRNINAAYVDFGDGTGMRLGRTPLDTANLRLAPGTVLHYGTGNSAVSDANFYIGYGPYYIHTYKDSSLKTISFYHNDGTETPAFDPWVYPATSLFRVTNFRGNYPQHMPFLGGTSYQQPGASSVAGVSNWSSISSITIWYPYGGYYGNLIDPWRNMRYAQDFLAADTNLTTIRAANGSYYTQGYADTTFTLSRLKSNWNTYFTKLTAIAICEDQWNHEDLSVIPNLSYFNLVAANQYHSNVPGGNPIIPLASGEIDTIFNQIAAGSGQHISGGFIVIHSGGSTYTSQGVSALNYLKSKGWTIYLNGVIQ
ncbi:hypothetical protein GCM10011511_14260 [Puia dinghuensis]|uniref:RHS repeat-associated core domain-containing protein n=1 Tax=Puia dinghuensis TaxID=1792502 RepID=A0A8J2UBL1_9BACT|nr:hypothetical protein GCM10011511_14260 [Puia dinghuensis]